MGSRVFEKNSQSGIEIHEHDAANGLTRGGSFGPALREHGQELNSHDT